MEEYVVNAIILLIRTRKNTRYEIIKVRSPKFLTCLNDVWFQVTRYGEATAFYFLNFLGGSFLDAD